MFLLPVSAHSPASMVNPQGIPATTRKLAPWVSRFVACLLAAVLVVPTPVAVSLGLSPGAEERQQEYGDPLIGLYRGAWLRQGCDAFVCSMVAGFGGGPLTVGPLRPWFGYQGAFAPHCHHLASAPLRN